MNQDVAPIHFAHANGFPKGCYAAVFGSMQEGHAIIGKELLAHDPVFPVRVGWGNLAEEIIAYIEGHAHGPVIGVGHSMGGAATYIAARIRPDLFRGLILLDPVMPVDLKFRLSIKLARKLGFIGKVTPARFSAGRRNGWDSLEEARAYFGSRKLFRSFDQVSLEAFLLSGLYKEEGRYFLTFRPETEVAIFNSVPDDLNCFSGKPLPMAAYAVYGRSSELYSGERASILEKKHGLVVELADGGHMFPLESPRYTADIIEKLIERII